MPSFYTYKPRMSVTSPAEAERRRQSWFATPPETVLSGLTGSS